MRKFVVSCLASMVFMLIYFAMFYTVEAAGSVNLSANKTTVNVGDTFTVSVNLRGASVATLTARLSVDAQKVQYVSGPSNSNYSNGRVIYTWTDPTGGNSPLTGGTVATFTFTAKSAGNASFGISGEFFTPEETSANPSFSGVTVSVNSVQNNTGGESSGGNTGNENGGSTNGGGTGNQTGGTTGGQTSGTAGNQTGGTTGNQTGGTTGNQIGGATGNQTGSTAGNQAGGTAGNQTGGNTGNQTGSSSGNTTGRTAGNQNGGTTGKTNNDTNVQAPAGNQPASSNTNLKILQLNIEGINPNFSPENTQYYLTIPETIENIGITAEPEDSKSTVQISGNNNIQIGANQIIISVTAENGTQKDYTINVTKTDNAGIANANLENLAIENATLIPEFNSEIMDYTAEVFGEMDKLNILAVPQNENAHINIEGNEKLQYGENQIKITVLAEDGLTSKVYNIVVTKSKAVNEEENITENSNEENGQNASDIVDNAVEKNVKKEKVIMIILLVALAIVTIIWFIWKKKKFNKGD